jgi:uncharacterized SAM-binding protein YcdF (DUF218 family)
MFVLAFVVLFIWLVARNRKNWARWVLLILFAMGLPFAVSIIRGWLALRPIVGVFSLSQILVQVIAFLLVFTGNARDWFKKTPQNSRLHLLCHPDLDGRFRRPALTDNEPLNARVAIASLRSFSFIEFGERFRRD